MRENEHFRETLADIRTTFGADVKMLTVAQVASYLNCDRRSVANLIKKRKLAAADINPYGSYGVYRVQTEELARFITKKER